MAVDVDTLFVNTHLTDTTVCMSVGSPTHPLCNDQILMRQLRLATALQ